MMPAPETPLISVIVPVYNVEAYVAACIRSLKAQTINDFEVIVVDDGATDDSHAEALRAIENDPRFKLIRRPNSGLSAARNTGLEHARGHFVAFVDSDDQVAPDYLSALHNALENSTADWAACGVRSVYPGGGHQDHSAIHSASVLDPKAAPGLWPMRSWAEVIDHFPSAWNKLYRASLIEGLRFDEGTLFEDHAFFQQAARRTDTIMHVPRPLYLQTRARPGQITGEDSDRVFDQISVLERLAGLMDSAKPGSAQAYATLASRLLYERAGVIRNQDRRQAFLAAGQALLTRHNLRYMPDWKTGIGPSLGLELAGHVPLSIVIPWDGVGNGLQQSLCGVAEAASCGAEVVVVCDNVALAEACDVAKAAGVVQAFRAIPSDGHGPGAARNCGLDAARGAYIVFLDAGDQIAPWAGLHQVGAMMHFGAQMGLMPFQIGTAPDAPIHPGFHNSAGVPPASAEPCLLEMTPDMACGLYCHPSSKIFDREFLANHGLRFGTGALADWRIGIQAALCAPRVLRFAVAGIAISQDAEHRLLWTGAVPPRALAEAIAEIGQSLPQSSRAALPSGWQHRLLGRALWEKLGFTPMSRFGRLRYLLAASGEVAALDPFPEGAVLDPYLGNRLTDLISAAGRPRLHCIMRALRR